LPRLTQRQRTARWQRERRQQTVIVIVFTVLLFGALGLVAWAATERYYTDNLKPAATIEGRVIPYRLFSRERAFELVRLYVQYQVPVELENDPRRHVRPTFPNATYVVQQGDLEFARHTNERTRASYLPPNFEPIAAAHRWRLLEGDGEVLSGLSVRLTPGHVPFHQAVLVRDAGETAVFVADLIPTVAHLPLTWIMGYDLEPLRTLESKRALLRDAVAGGWRLVFEHDPTIASGIPIPEGKGVALRDVIRVDAPVAVGSERP